MIVYLSIIAIVGGMFGVAGGIRIPELLENRATYRSRRVIANQVRSVVIASQNGQLNLAKVDFNSLEQLFNATYAAFPKMSPTTVNSLSEALNKEKEYTSIPNVKFVKSVFDILEEFIILAEDTTANSETKRQVWRNRLYSVQNDAIDLESKSSAAATSAIYNSSRKSLREKSK